VVNSVPSSPPYPLPQVICVLDLAKACPSTCGVIANTFFKVDDLLSYIIIVFNKIYSPVSKSLSVH
jgi:hypothetical protein